MPLRTGSRAGERPRRFPVQRLARGRHRSRPAPRGRGRAPVDDAAAHRIGELHLSGGPRRHRLDPDQQVRRGLPRPPLLRRQPGRRPGRGPRTRPVVRAVRRRARQRAAPRRRGRQSRGLPGVARTRRHRPRDAPRPGRAPHPRLAGEHHLEDLALRRLRGVRRDRRPRQAGGDHRFRPGRRHRAGASAPP